MYIVFIPAKSATCGWRDIAPWMQEYACCGHTKRGHYEKITEPMRLFLSGTDVVFASIIDLGTRAGFLKRESQSIYGFPGPSAR